MNFRLIPAWSQSLGEFLLAQTKLEHRCLQTSEVVFGQHLCLYFAVEMLLVRLQVFSTVFAWLLFPSPSFLVFSSYLKQLYALVLFGAMKSQSQLELQPQRSQEGRRTLARRSSEVVSACEFRTDEYNVF